ncbi:MAG TPA: hypothetical protein VNP02_09080 [Gammaproteobacteria bacterium]|jgi:hypothetical protein|nr:hypothetical protein [Gammaproteobacteria bacterium]
MSGTAARFAEQHDTREPGTERPPASTPVLESVHADGYRWASLDIADLDPPTWFPPH